MASRKLESNQNYIIHKILILIVRYVGKFFNICLMLVDSEFGQDLLVIHDPSQIEILQSYTSYFSSYLVLNW